jgi:hypothetical protein
VVLQVHCLRCLGTGRTPGETMTLSVGLEVYVGYLIRKCSYAMSVSTRFAASDSFPPVPRVLLSVPHHRSVNEVRRERLQLPVRETRGSDVPRTVHSSVPLITPHTSLPCVHLLLLRAFPQSLRQLAPHFLFRFIWHAPGATCRAPCIAASGHTRAHLSPADAERPRLARGGGGRQFRMVRR